MNIEIHPPKILIKLLYLILGLLLANVIVILAQLYIAYDYIRWLPIQTLLRLFDFSMEMNIPTLYSSFALVIAGVLLAVIASLHQRQGESYLPWVGLALIFLFLSVDELAGIHEILTEFVRESLNTSGLLFYAWVIPYGIALIAFVGIYFRFILRLPRKTMVLFVASGAIFVIGAIGFELLGGRYADLYGVSRANSNYLTYAFFYTCEELFEMLGIVVFIYALLSYITGQFKYLTITIHE
ncbi:MAG: hypothetical protein JXA33_22760 [Anaerolineae bacterium]|nr:hypothetical protein [Anaerolineae bacterium]